MSIPVASKPDKKSSIPIAEQKIEDRNLLFSFALVEKNKYFNLDGTCQNWAADLFVALQKASNIPKKDVDAKRYSGHTSPFRIHPHLDVKYPCAKPDNAQIEDMWQIRISTSKGGVHGFFIDNVFYIIWFDPQHNLYPDENHGGLKKIIPPSTCCKDRDEELKILKTENAKLKDEIKAFEDLFSEAAK